MPPTTTSVIPTAMAMIASISSAVPSPRGMPCLCIQATSGEATAATIPAVSTGSTITCVSESSQMMPTSNSPKPTSSHDICPAPRSHCGTQTISLSSRASISTPSSALPLDSTLCAFDAKDRPPSTWPGTYLGHAIFPVVRAAQRSCPGALALSPEGGGLPSTPARCLFGTTHRSGLTVDGDSCNARLAGAGRVSLRSRTKAPHLVARRRDQHRLDVR